jgi:Protein of unknown function (DUF1559)
MESKKRHFRWSVFCVMMLAAILVGLVVWGVSFVREAASQGACQGRFSQMQFALTNYHATHGHFPPAFVAGPDGKPWHSWRVLILPFMEHSRVYDSYRFDEPWDGPNNRLLADKIYLPIFQCRSGAEYGKTYHTNIVAIVGDGTAFPGAGSTQLSDFRDGGKNTILLAEYRNSDIHWMEPRDLNAGEMSFQVNDPAAPSISSPHAAGPAVVFADGITVYRLRRPLSVDTLSALVRTRSEKRVRRDDLEHWDSRNGKYLSE